LFLALGSLLSGCSVSDPSILAEAGKETLAAKLEFVVEPGDQLAGKPFSNFPTVAILDSNGNVAKKSSSVVTLTMTSSSGHLLGSTSVVADEGVARFEDLSIDDTSTEVILTATSEDLHSAKTSEFAVNYGTRAIGQPDSNNNYNLEYSMMSPQNSVTDGTKLFVADSGNNRVLIWNSIPTTNQRANMVLGHSNFTGASTRDGINSRTFNHPSYVFADGTKIAVVDQNNNRVLIWNKYPSSNYASADIVLGQPDMTSNTDNNGGVRAQSLSSPTQAFWKGSKFFVVDANNSRVLIWNSFPTTNGQPADVVIGQPNMTSNTPNNGGISARTLSYPMGASYDGTRLFVSDNENHRVLGWNALPSTDQVAADLVLGQPDMVSSAGNNGGKSGQTLLYPGGVYTDGSKLFIADYSNRRVLGWNTMPTVNQQVADFVLGQPDMTAGGTNNGGISARSMNVVTGVSVSGGKLIVSDSGNSRVLIWNAVPATTHVAADRVIGQPDFISDLPNNSGTLSNNLRQPGGIYNDGDRFAVADTLHNRILIWKKIPASNNIPADLVLGQPDLTSSVVNNGGLSALSLNSPQALCSDGTKLFVVDKGNNRVLIWNSWPTSNQQPANLVLGQPDMVSNTYNNGGLSASTLFRPFDCAVDSGRLFVVDQANMRVLIWNTIPTTNQQAANLVQGQGNMTQRYYLSTPTGGMINPSSVAISGTKLIVADTSDHRVMIWNTIPTVNRQNPDVYIGQADGTTQTENLGGLSAKSLFAPMSVRMIDGRLYVADGSNHRVLYWNSVPASSYSNADGVFGQPDFTSSSPNNGGLSHGRLFNPSCVAGSVFNGIKHLLISDTDNDRVTLTPY
jgi:hypothetical protein